MRGYTPAGGSPARLAAAMWQARAELLAIQVQQAEERVLVLEAPRESTPAGIASGQPTGGVLSDGPHQPAPPQRP